ncbi:MAG TPA: hypothetical protein VHG70_13345 [Nocardioidaceae bacterium]|nr:hypothetical protein [Nocardioidaceae bacterium]
MSPFSGAVLGAAAVLSAPALWSSLVEGTMPVADGLLRYLVVVAICWLALSVVVALVGPAPRPAVQPGQPGQPADQSAARDDQAA